MLKLQAIYPFHQPREPIRESKGGIQQVVVQAFYHPGSRGCGSIPPLEIPSFLPAGESRVLQNATRGELKRFATLVISGLEAMGQYGAIPFHLNFIRVST